MTVHLSPAEARRAGIVAPKARTTRKTEPRAGATTRCVRHDAEFTADSTETAHVNQHHGCRIEAVMG